MLFNLLVSYCSLANSSQLAANSFLLPNLFANWLLSARSQLLLHDAEDFFLAHDEKLLAVELDLGAGVLAEQNLVARLDVQREDFAFVVRLALAHGDHFALLGLFLGAVGDDDATADGFALFQTADEDAVMERSESSCYRC